MKQSVNQRIKIFVDRQGLTDYRFAKTTGVSTQTVSHLFSKAKDVSGETLAKIALAYPDLNLRWLLTGEGDPVTHGPKPKKSVTTEIENLDNEMIGGPPVKNNYKNTVDKEGKKRAKVLPLFRVNRGRYVVSL